MVASLSARSFQDTFHLHTPPVHHVYEQQVLLSTAHRSTSCWCPLKRSDDCEEENDSWIDAIKCVAQMTDTNKPRKWLVKFDDKQWPLFFTLTDEWLVMLASLGGLLTRLKQGSICLSWTARSVHDGSLARDFVLGVIDKKVRKAKWRTTTTTMQDHARLAALLCTQH